MNESEKNNISAGRIPAPVALSADGASPYARPVVGETRIGSSLITDTIGIGGMATVYKVWNEGLEVERAIKMLSREASSARFETEAKIVAKLRHEGIVEVYSTGVWNGLPYMEMEFVDGFDLQQTLHERGKLPEDVCVAIATLVAEALSHAHTQMFSLSGKQYCGIIHRDLKPANILISKNGEVKLTDFGIARPAQASLHTVDGAIIGTMYYLSPEQMDGVEIDNRSDIYSLGAILYEMVTGERTFPQETVTELMVQKSLNRFKMPLEYGIQISPKLQEIILRCLKFDPNERYQRTQDLVADLRQLHGSLAQSSPKETLRNFFCKTGGASGSVPVRSETPVAQHMQEQRAEQSWAQPSNSQKIPVVTAPRTMMAMGAPETAMVSNDQHPQPQKKSSALAVIIVLLLLCGAGAGAYYYYDKYMKPQLSSPTEDADDIEIPDDTEEFVDEVEEFEEPAKPTGFAEHVAEPEPVVAKTAAATKTDPPKVTKVDPPKPDYTAPPVVPPSPPSSPSRPSSKIFLKRGGSSNPITDDLIKVLGQKVPLSSGNCTDGVTVSIESDAAPSCVESMIGGIICKANATLTITQCADGQKLVLNGSLVGADTDEEELARKQFTRNIKTSKFWSEWVKELEKWTK